MTARRDDFDAYARDPATWLLAARRNWCAAELLLEQSKASARSEPENWERFSGLLFAGYLHAGLAIENAVKGLLIGRNPDIVGDGRVRKDAFGSRQHALIELLELANWPLDADDHKIVAKLEQFVVWAGKYAAPLGATAIDSSEKLDLLRNSTTNESVRLRALIFRLLEQPA